MYNDEGLKNEEFFYNSNMHFIIASEMNIDSKCTQLGIVVAELSFVFYKSVPYPKSKSIPDKL